MLRQAHMIGISWNILEYPYSNMTSVLGWYFIGIFRLTHLESNVHFKRFLQGCSHIKTEAATKLAGQHPATSQSQTQTRLRQALSIENMEWMGNLNRKPWSWNQHFEVFLQICHSTRKQISRAVWGCSILQFNYRLGSGLMTLLRSWFDFQPLSRTSIDSAPVPFGTAIIPSSSASGGYLLLTTRRNSSVTNLVGSHLFGRFNLKNMIYNDLQHLFCSCKSSRVCPKNKQHVIKAPRRSDIQFFMSSKHVLVTATWRQVYIAMISRDR